MTTSYPLIVLLRPKKVTPASSPPKSIRAMRAMVAGTRLRALKKNKVPAHRSLLLRPSSTRPSAVPSLPRTSSSETFRREAVAQLYV